MSVSFFWLRDLPVETKQDASSRIDVYTACTYMTTSSGPARSIGPGPVAPLLHHLASRRSGPSWKTRLRTAHDQARLPMSPLDEFLEVKALRCEPEAVEVHDEEAPAQVMEENRRQRGKGRWRAPCRYPGRSNAHDRVELGASCLLVRAAERRSAEKRLVGLHCVPCVGAGLLAKCSRRQAGWAIRARGCETRGTRRARKCLAARHWRPV